MNARSKASSSVSAPTSSAVSMNRFDCSGSSGFGAGLRVMAFGPDWVLLSESASYPLCGCSARKESKQCSRMARPRKSECVDCIIQPYFNSRFDYRILGGSAKKVRCGAENIAINIQCLSRWQFAFGASKDMALINSILMFGEYVNCGALPSDIANIKQMAVIRNRKGQSERIRSVGCKR